LRMSQYMMIVAAKTENSKLAKTVLDDIFSINHLRWSQETVLICLRTLCQFGLLPLLLKVYDRMYLDGNIPDLRHWSCMLRGAARSGCPKYFARFHQRIEKKGYELEKPFVRSLLNEWALHDDWTWKLSKQACIRTFDFSVMIALAQRYRNYKLAIQFIHDIYKLDTQPTVQVYEVFSRGISRDFPRFRLDARDWRLKWTGKTGILDKQVRLDFESWVSDIEKYIGPENLSCVPLQPIVRRPKRQQTRKERMAEKGILRERIRYTSRFTDNDKLFEMAPAYLRRIKYEEEKKKKEELSQQKDEKIDQEIEKAKEAKKKWDLFGFKMNYAVDDEISSGPLPKETFEPIVELEKLEPEPELTEKRKKVKRKKRPLKGKDRYRPF